jgi:hypothetical protein
MDSFDLIIANAYFQANLIKGWRYLDDAGKIANRWLDQFSETSMGIDGLIMRKPGATLRELQVSVERIWLAFSAPDTVRFVCDQSAKICTDISDVIDVNSYKRLGIRLQYIYGMPDIESCQTLSRKLVSHSAWDSLKAAGLDLSSAEVSMNLRYSELKLKLSISSVKRVVTPTKPDKLPSIGIMIDMDLYQDKETAKAKILSFVRAVENWVNKNLNRIAELSLKEG